MDFKLQVCLVGGFTYNTITAKNAKLKLAANAKNARSRTEDSFASFAKTLRPLRLNGFHLKIRIIRRMSKHNMSFGNSIFILFQS